MTQMIQIKTIKGIKLYSVGILHFFGFQTRSVFLLGTIKYVKRDECYHFYTNNGYCYSLLSIDEYDLKQIISIIDRLNKKLFKKMSKVKK